MNTEWKPIASAPKDGTRVLLWNEKFTAPCSGQFYGFDDWKMDSDIPPFAFQPTHWIPLPPAPTSHPIPTGATGDRDWELACDNCNGSGHVFVKHQVAERKTDVQEFKEECECCEGRGFNIAFEDIPGIAEYVKSCRPSPAAGDALRLALEALEAAQPIMKHYTEPNERHQRAIEAVRAAIAQQSQRKEA